jgi:hypothetical protein
MGNPGAVEIVKLFQAESDAVLWHHWRQGKARPEVEPLTISPAPKTVTELLLDVCKQAVMIANVLDDHAHQLVAINARQDAQDERVITLEVLQDSVIEATDAAIDFVHKRVDVIDDRYQAIRQNLLNLDDLDGTPQRLSDRKKVGIIVENYVNATTAGTRKDYQDAWIALYIEFNRKEEVNLTVQCRNTGLKQLDYIEKWGKMHSLLELARAKYANPLIKRLR